MNEMVACGECVPSFNIRMGKRLFDYVSIMSAELNAIFMVIEYLMNNQLLSPNIQNIIVCSDSTSTLELLHTTSQ